jgi:hypothetical protein
MTRWVPLARGLVVALGLKKRYNIRVMTNDARSPAQATSVSHRNLDHVIDELFTQAHLEIHMLWHPQHVDLVAAQWTSVFGVSPDQINSDVSTKHLTRLQAAHLHRDRRARIERDSRALYEGIAENANPVPVA